MQVLLCIDAPHYCAGLVLTNGRCTEAAPILNWALGRSGDDLRQYFARKKFRVHEIEIEP